MPAQLAEHLGRRIVEGRLAPGSVLLLEDLMREHAVSRTVARDAVKSLAQLGLVGVKRRVGTVVADPTSWDELAPLVIRWRLAGPERLTELARISELRMGVEPVAAKLAASRATSDQAQTLAQAAFGMTTTARIPDLETYLVHDITFHRTILAASGNPLFASLGDVVAEVLSGRTHHHLMPPTPNPEAVRWHVDVAAAIAAGNGEEAERIMRLMVTEAQAGAAAMAAAG